MCAASFLTAVYFDSGSQSCDPNKQGENSISSEASYSPKENISDV